jgi:predicted RNA-binding protein associated with RNAse of E/G family
VINSTVTIIKNDHRGEEVWRYAGKIFAETPKGIIAEAFFNRADLEFNGITLKEGDRFVELYLFGKWFNIYEIYDRDDQLLKAWYCNITRPVRLLGNEVHYDDLALDLLVFPDRRQLALDEDEFVALGLNKADQQNARSALKELKNLFSQNEKVNIRDLV